MAILVRYKDETMGYIPSYELNNLLDSNRILAFRRSSGWVQLGKDPLRGQGCNGAYRGPERRRRW